MKNKLILLSLLCMINICTFSIKANAQCPLAPGANPICHTGSTNVSTDGGYSTLTESWASTNTAAAVVSYTAGTGTCTVTAVAAGTTTIKYNDGLGANCSFILTVDPTPSVPTAGGTLTVCAGSITTLSGNPAGGTWTSTNTMVAMADPVTGDITGVSAGTSAIRYTVTNSCAMRSVSKTVTVNALPDAGTITSSTLDVCVGGSTITLSDATTGGVWSSTDPTIADVGAGSGIVTGMSAGSTDISYTVTDGVTGCEGSAIVTVNSDRLANAGTIGTGTSNNSVCVGGTINFTSTGDAGGAWSSHDLTIATVDGAGVISGVAAGTTTITYAVANACSSADATATVVVQSPLSVGSISGTAIVCAGAATALSEGTTGGGWSSDNTAIATVDGSGNVSGVAGGTTTISYTVSNSCGSVSASQVVTVNPAPNAGTISGAAYEICHSGSVSLSSSGDAGGVWSSNNTSAATVGASSGTVYGVAGGTATITYSVTNMYSCIAYTTQTITVDATLTTGSITGTSGVCTGANTALSDGSGSVGGIWSSTATSIATVDGSGNVFGVTTGTVTISYTVSNACGTLAATNEMTVNTIPTVGAITGADVVCTSSNITLSDATGGGSWSSSNTLIATVGVGGVVYGVSAGTVTITYAIGSSCGTANVTQTVTVNETPNAGTLSGVTPSCAGTGNYFTSSGDAGGIWSSNNSSVATVTSATGDVTGLTAGTATISYELTNTCGLSTATTDVTIDAVPAMGIAESGIYAGPYDLPYHLLEICQSTASGLTLSGSPSGGTWSSYDNTIATITSGGIVNPVPTYPVDGYAYDYFIYTISNSCGSFDTSREVIIDASSVAATILGYSPIYISTVSYYSGMPETGIFYPTGNFTVTGGASWSFYSGYTYIAEVTFPGAPGVVNITYTYSNTCGNFSSSPFSVTVYH